MFQPLTVRAYAWDKWDRSMNPAASNNNRMMPFFGSAYKMESVAMYTPPPSMSLMYYIYMVNTFTMAHIIPSGWFTV